MNKWEKSRFCSARCRWDFLKGKDPYNKGKRMADLVRGYVHPFKGKTHTLQSRGKIKLARSRQAVTEPQLTGLAIGRNKRLRICTQKRVTKLCATCGKEMILSLSRSHLKNCSWECFGIYQSMYRRGEKSGGYIHGYDGSPYHWKFRDKLKEKIRERDGHICRVCHDRENGVKLSIHHIDYNKLNSDKNNLISLCVGCHAKTNRRRKYWQSYFSAIMGI